MKTTVFKEKETESEFPVLMIYKNDIDRPDPLIVKFFDKYCGCVMSQNYNVEDSFLDWKSSANFNINEFVKFSGKIIIEQ